MNRNVNDLHKWRPFSSLLPFIRCYVKINFDIANTKTLNTYPNCLPTKSIYSSIPIYNAITRAIGTLKQNLLQVLRRTLN